MDRRLVSTTLTILAAVGSACGQTTMEPGASGTTPLDTIEVTSTLPTTTTSAAGEATTTMLEDFVQTATASAPQASWDHRFVAIYGNYATENSSAIRYLAASSNDQSDLVDPSWEEFRFELPFGVKVTNGQIDVSEGPNRPAPKVLWPVECLGVAPDVDGDSLLDDCDPYPADGPLADWDDDGVINPNDNCPTVANPDQAVIGERSSGVVCDGREGVAPSVWVVQPTVTIEAWNNERARQGLEPLSMPTGPAPLPPEVAAWCATEPTADDVEPAADAVQALVSDIPDAYGLTSEQRTRLGEISIDLSELLEEYTALEADPEAAVEAAGTLDGALARFAEIEQRIWQARQEIAPYLAPLLDSDLACHLER